MKKQEHSYNKSHRWDLRWSLSFHMSKLSGQSPNTYIHLQHWHCKLLVAKMATEICMTSGKHIDNKDNEVTVTSEDIFTKKSSKWKGDVFHSVRFPYDFSWLWFQDICSWTLNSYELKS